MHDWATLGSAVTVTTCDSGVRHDFMMEPQQTKRVREDMPARVLWLALGFISIACGIAGVLLPLVPTTPFLLLAALAFARSSPRLHNWLVTHPRLGPPIADWRAHGAIRRRSKIAAVAVMGATLLFSVVMNLSGMVLLVQAVVMCASAAFILTRPDGPAGNE